MSIFVCNDLDGVSPWVYDPETKRYMRLTPDGKPDKVGKTTARLNGNDIPDPNKLWELRQKQLEIAKANGVKITGEEIKASKPSVATFALWNHWQGVKNAD